MNVTNYTLDDLFKKLPHDIDYSFIFVSDWSTWHISAKNQDATDSKRIFETDGSGKTPFDAVLDMILRGGFNTHDYKPDLEVSISHLKIAEKKIDGLVDEIAKMNHEHYQERAKLRNEIVDLKENILTLQRENVKLKIKKQARKK